MEEFLRDLYESDISGAQLGHAVPIEVRKMIAARDELYENLHENLSEEDFRLLNKYDNLNGSISNEERYYAFKCGIKTFAKFLKSFFCP